MHRLITVVVGRSRKWAIRGGDSKRRWSAAVAKSRR